MGPLAMKQLLALAWIATAAPLLAAPPYNSGFASGEPGDYLAEGFPPERVQITPMDGDNVMLLDDTAVGFEDMPVQPNSKYTLSFEGSFTGDVESIEENSRFEIFTRLGGVSPVLPSRRLEFLDNEGRPLDLSLQYAMPFRSQHCYTDVFYTPADAASLRLHIASGDDIVFNLRNLTLAATADEGSINVNPAFRLGPQNYSGWQRISAGGQIVELDGKTVLDTKYGSRGMAFPLPGPGTYALSAKATANGYNSCVQVHVFDAKGNALLKVSTRQYGPPRYFVPPKEAVAASFLVYSCLLEEVRLVRVGDESAIDTVKK
jgi:hypothetical protein